MLDAIVKQVLPALRMLASRENVLNYDGWTTGKFFQRLRTSRSSENYPSFRMIKLF